jgi:dihydrofolate reductase
MGKLVFGVMQSLDGYVAGAPGGPRLPPPGERLHHHFSDHVRGLAGIIYGRRMFEVMRYWDDGHPDWGAVERDFAAAWRPKPKWVMSRTLKSVGPNATLVGDDVGAFVRALKAKRDGEIDEYRLYLRTFVLGGGKPFFSGPRPPLHLVGTEAVGEDAVRLTYAT